MQSAATLFGHPCARYINVASRSLRPSKHPPIFPLTNPFIIVLYSSSLPHHRSKFCLLCLSVSVTLLSTCDSWLHPITDFPSAKRRRCLCCCWAEGWASLLSDAWVPLMVPVELMTSGKKTEFVVYRLSNESFCTVKRQVILRTGSLIHQLFGQEMRFVLFRYELQKPVSVPKSSDSLLLSRLVCYLTARSISM
jgi:hypothetical protein